MGGFFVMQRGWMDSPVFGSARREPLCRRAAWAWMIERAEYAPTQARIEGRAVDLARGEFSISIRDMGSEWGWPTTKVARFVSELYQHRFIGTRKIGRQFVISICDYDQFSYQKPQENRTDETKLERSWNDNPADARVVIKEVELKEEEVGSLRSPTARATPKAFDAWYAEYPHKVGRAAAEKAYRSALARASPETLLEGLRRYIASKPPDRAWCGPAVWLNQHRWLDESAENDGRTYQNGRPNRASGADNLLEGFGRAVGYGAPDSGPDRSAAGPLLDGEYARFDA